MTEELYIFKNGKRYRLDLNSPSGITLSFKSPILNDLSSFDSSKSYTFNLPFTSNNSNVFDNVEDIRVDVCGVGKCYDAEYIVDGITIVHDGNLYVSTIGSSYSAVVTWNVLKQFKKLSESEDTLRDLYDEGEDYNNIVLPFDNGQPIGIATLVELDDDSTDAGEGGDDGDNGYDGPDYDAPDIDY